MERTVMKIDNDVLSFLLSEKNEIEKKIIMLTNKKSKQKNMYLSDEYHFQKRGLEQNLQDICMSIWLVTVTELSSSKKE
jgi:hypothetical protein